MLRTHLLLPVIGFLMATGCVSDDVIVSDATDGEMIVMDGVIYNGEIVDSSSPIISAPESLRPITPPKEITEPPAELAPPPKKLPPAKPIPATPSSMSKDEVEWRTSFAD